MKKVIVACAALLGLFASCKNENAKEEVPTVQKEVVVEEPVYEECFLGILKKDTVSMSLIINGNKVSSGKLSYKFFEKDKNDCTLIGEMKGDTLYADYTFMSEGVSSVRQVAFLKKGNMYAEGYGDLEDNNGKTFFKNTKDLKFDGKMVLSKVDCKK
ncbi:MAG TPA: hypothetical protein VLR29_00960 [Flavobacterium sp.]|nr:hypothetical protein [Flavobacterium sp.]